MADNQVTLEPCLKCGADVSVQIFTGPCIDGEARVLICSNHALLHGNCPSEFAALNDEAWNQRNQHACREVPLVDLAALKSAGRMAARMGGRFTLNAPSGGEVERKEIPSFQKPYAEAGHDLESLFAAPEYKCIRCGANQIDCSEDLAYGEMRACAQPAPRPVEAGKLLDSCIDEIGFEEPFVVERLNEYLGPTQGVAELACTQLSAWAATHQGHPIFANSQQSLSAARAEIEGETWESINEWCDITFGPATIPQIIARAKEEFVELEGEDADHAIEAADVVICLCRIPGFAEALQRKMGINRKRKWRLTGDGTGYHIPDAALSTDKGEG